MFNLGPLELMAIFVVALLVFGPDKLPEIGRQVGRAIREFKKFQSGFQNEFRDVLDPPPGSVIPDAAARDTARREAQPPVDGSPSDPSAPPAGGGGSSDPPPDATR